MNFTTPESKARLKAYYEQRNEQFQAWCDSGYDYRAKPQQIPLPPGLEDMRCGARTKATGKPCKRKDIYSSGRCKLHGGLSTGAKTQAGKKKSALNGFKKGWRKLAAQSNKAAIRTP